MHKKSVGRREKNSYLPTFYEYYFQGKAICLEISDFADFRRAV
jgi:hypothetical protein